MTEQYPRYYAELKSQDNGTKPVHLKNDVLAIQYFWSKFDSDVLAIIKDDGNGNIECIQEYTEEMN